MGVFTSDVFSLLNLQREEIRTNPYPFYQQLRNQEKRAVHQSEIQSHYSRDFKPGEFSSGHLRRQWRPLLLHRRYCQ